MARKFYRLILLIILCNLLILTSFLNHSEANTEIMERVCKEPTYVFTNGISSTNISKLLYDDNISYHFRGIGLGYVGLGENSTLSILTITFNLTEILPRSEISNFTVNTSCYLVSNTNDIGIIGVLNLSALEENGIFYAYDQGQLLNVIPLNSKDYVSGTITKNETNPFWIGNGTWGKYGCAMVSFLVINGTQDKILNTYIDLCEVYLNENNSLKAPILEIYLFGCSPEVRGNELDLYYDYPYLSSDIPFGLLRLYMFNLTEIYLNETLKSYDLSVFFNFTKRNVANTFIGNYTTYIETELNFSAFDIVYNTIGNYECIATINNTGILKEGSNITGMLFIFNETTANKTTIHDIYFCFSKNHLIISPSGDNNLLILSISGISIAFGIGLLFLKWQKKF